MSSIQISEKPRSSDRPIALYSFQFLMKFPALRRFRRPLTRQIFEARQSDSDAHPIERTDEAIRREQAVV